MTDSFLHRYSTWLALALAVLFAAQAYWGNREKSLVWDEPSYISGGYTYLTWDDFRLNPSHPPLMQDLFALPLLFMDLRTPAMDDPSFRNAENPVVEFGYQFLFESGNDFLAITRWARLPSLIAGTLLVLSVYLWGTNLYGRGPALLGAALTALCPNLVGYAKVATEDMGCVTLMFMAVWTLWRGLRKSTLANWSLCGLVTGLALVSKYTALLLGPVYVVLALGTWWMDRERLRLAEVVKGGMIVVALSLLVIGASYNFSFDYSLYLNGLGQIYGDMTGRAKSYLFGRVYDEPLWYYYIAAMLLKAPAPTLLLIAVSAFAALRARTGGQDALFLLIPAGSILLASCFDPLNLGLRRILPAFPFLFLFAAGTVANSRNRAKTGFVALMVCWLIFEAWLIYPHHLTYFSSLAGGARRGPYLLGDANIDQGQDLPALAKWQRERNGGRPIKLFYNGAADPMAYGVTPLQMEEQEILFPHPGVYAISTNNLVMFRYLKAKKGYDVDWLTKYKPVAYAGNSIFIYRFD